MHCYCCHLYTYVHTSAKNCLYWRGPIHMIVITHTFYSYKLWIKPPISKHIWLPKGQEPGILKHQLERSQHHVHVFCLPNSSTVVLASLGWATSKFPLLYFPHPPNVMTWVHPGPKHKAVTVWSIRGCRLSGKVIWENWMNIYESPVWNCWKLGFTFKLWPFLLKQIFRSCDRLDILILHMVMHAINNLLQVI